MVSITRKIKKSELYKLAEIYHINGFDDIPIDEARNMTYNKKRRIKIYMDKMKQDEEQRVWYVGLTRCSQNLFLIRCKDRSKEFKL